LLRCRCAWSMLIWAIRDPATPSIQTDALLDTYFTRFHNKPFHIFDESVIRKRIQLNQLPPFLFDAIAAVAARYVSSMVVPIVYISSYSYVGTHRILAVSGPPSSWATNMPREPGVPLTSMSRPLTIFRPLCYWQLHILPRERGGRPLCY
jgi:hypothetical protein